MLSPQISTLSAKPADEALKPVRATGFNTGRSEEFFSLGCRRPELLCGGSLLLLMKTGNASTPTLLIRPRMPLTNTVAEWKDIKFATIIIYRESVTI
jgi:hypothetical protein